ncbi:hypothetical protein [uncultured Megasphaera sp.]|uniref:hypothetical protein n=1 Tax=uncultured Megasphaera sp. TaxID=165188 RepID=UPI002658B2F0|nr:hypothetical protein [uncultured Megasphaera sp.]
MTKCQELYEFYKQNPQAKNAEVAEALHWDPYHVRKYKFRLKSRGLIAITPDGVETAPLFADEDVQEPSAKFAAYQHLYDVCVERLQTKDMSDSQFISLVQEIRMILAKM